MKKVFLKISKNSQENTCARVFIKRETPTQVFSCKIFETFNTSGGCFCKTGTLSRNGLITPKTKSSCQVLLKFVTFTF